MKDTSPPKLGAARVIRLDVARDISDPALQRMVGTVRGLRPPIERCAEEQGPGATIAALIIIAGNMAMDAGEEGLVAELFRDCADMLELTVRTAEPLGNA